MPTLTVFRTNFVNSLRANIATNMSKYHSNQVWVLGFGSKATRDLATKIEMKSPLLLDLPDGENLKDLENTIRVHKFFRGMTPLQARDPRLWTRLTHVECWEYMRKRWPIEKRSADEERGARYIATRYFVAQNESRALLRNGVARLWWTGFVSVDGDRDNPYELTSVLLSALDISKNLLERNMGRSPVILKGFLEFLLANKRMLLTGGEQNRDRIRKLARFLNMYGGVCLLDCLAERDIMALLEGELGRITASERKKSSAEA